MQSVIPNVTAVMNRLNRMNLSPPKMPLFCSVCQVHVSSESVMEVHVKGKKHSQLEQKQRQLAASAAHSVYVQGLPAGSTADQLTEFFQQFGAVNKVILDREYGHYAIIEFAEDSTAKSVLSQPSVFMNNSRLTIRPRQMKGVQRKRKVKRGSEFLPQKHSSAITSAIAASATGTDFDDIKEELEGCNSLEEEVGLLVNVTSLSPEEIAIRQNILKELEAVLQNKFFPDCQVHLFGSSVNGLGTKGCDLDLFLDLKLEESSSHLSTPSKIDSEFGQHIIQSPCSSHDSVVPVNNNATSFDESVTSETNDSAIGLNDDSITCDDTKSEIGISRQVEEPKTLCTLSSKSLQESIKKISNVLRARKDVYTQVIRVISARCPVVKFIHLLTSLKCDLSINNRLALRNTSLIQFLLSVDCRIRPLVFSIRHWAKVRGVAGQLNAGPKLTNYALTMIVIFYLQTRSPPILPSINRLSHEAESRWFIEGWDCSFTTDLARLQPEADVNHLSNPGAEEKKSEGRESLEELLLGFFEFYSKLDFSLKVICLQTGKSVDLNAFSEKITSDPRLKDFKISPIMVQDPFVLNHNITSNVNEKSLLILQTELKAAATKFKIQLTTTTAGHPRPSLVPLFSSEPTNPPHSPASHLREIPPKASPGRDTRGRAHSFTVKAEASKLMAEALKQKKTFAKVQDEWCNNSAAIVRHTLKIFDIQSSLVEQPEKQTDCANPEEATASCHAIHDSDDLQAKTDTVDDMSHTVVQSETFSGLASKPSDCETHDKDLCPQDRPKICHEEVNHCRKRYSSEDDDGKELKRSKSGSEQNNSAASSSEQNDSTENFSISAENSCMENDSFECVNVTDEPSNLEPIKQPRSQMTRPLFSAECSTHSRLWMGRKKLRKQLPSVGAGDYEKEIQVSQILSSKLKSTEKDMQKDEGEVLLKFKIFLSAENSLSTAITVSMKTEGDQKSKEFSCFFFSFRSVVEKLVDIYGMEDIGEWKID